MSVDEHVTSTAIMCHSVQQLDVRCNIHLFTHSYASTMLVHVICEIRSSFLLTCSLPLPSTA